MRRPVGCEEFLLMAGPRVVREFWSIRRKIRTYGRSATVSGLTHFGQWIGSDSAGLIIPSGVTMKTRKVSQSQLAMETLEARECFSATIHPGLVAGITVATGDVNGNAPAVTNVMMGDGSVHFLDGSVHFLHVGAALPAVQ
jgi:hypothetical protein